MDKKIISKEKLIFKITNYEEDNVSSVVMFVKRLVL